MSETVDDVRHRMKRLLEMSPDRMDFKMGDMCCEFMLSAYDQVVTELDSERDALRCCKGEYTRLKRDFDELKQQLEEACAARDQWRQTHLNLKTALDALKSLPCIQLSQIGVACRSGQPDRCVRCSAIAQIEGVK